jgi:hypothetical protein
MRRVRLLRRPERPFRSLEFSELHRDGERGDAWETMLHFRHHCDEAWYTELIASCDLEGKKITPKRVRKLLVEALQRRRGEW